MTHEEYVENQRRRVGNLAKNMLAGDIPYLEGAIEIATLCHEVDLPGDADLERFVVVASEVDELPLGLPRQNWSKEVLKRHETALQEATNWAKETSLTQCKSLADRFNA